MRVLMMAMSLLGVSLSAACFPSLPPEVDDVEDGGLDTPAGGDTEPSPDTAPGGDTVTPPDGGECVGAQDCAHLAGTCVRLVCLDGTCATQPDTGQACDDGDPCTKDDVCDGYACAGVAYSCDDGEECTDDVCDGQGGCSYPAKAGHCFIGGTCYAAGETRPDDPCRVCAGGQAWSGNDGAPCDDGDDVCTLGDVCVGTECVPGGPPDDTVGDWATNVVKSVAPQAGVIQRIHPAGLGHWVFVAELTGGGVVPTTQGEVMVEGDQLVAVRRAPVSTFIQLQTEGFDRARLSASDDLNGRLGLVVAHDGPGVIHVGTSSLASESNTGHVAVVIDQLAVLSWSRALPHDVDSAALLTDGALAVAGSTNWSLLIDGATHLDAPPPSDEFNPFVVRYDATGVQWVGTVSTPGYWTADVAVTATNDGGLVLAFPFRSSATVRFPSGETTITSDSSNTTYGFVRVDSEGTISNAFAPIELSFEPQTGILAKAPWIQSAGDDLVVTLPGKLGATLPPILGPGEGKVSIAQVDGAGALVWARIVAQPTSVRLEGDMVVGIAAPGDSDPFEVLDLDGSSVHTSPSPSRTSLFMLDSDGTPSWVVDYPPSSSSLMVPLDVRRSPLGPSVVLGGAFIGSEVAPHPTNPGLVVSGDADGNAWAALMNSANGLTCGALTP